jgi:hypothetical protein
VRLSSEGGAVTDGPSVCAVGGSFEGTDDGTGDGVDTPDAEGCGLPSVCAVGCSASEGTDGGTGDTLDTVDCCLLQTVHQGMVGSATCPYCRDFFVHFHTQSLSTVAGWGVAVWAGHTIAGSGMLFL